MYYHKDQRNFNERTNNCHCHFKNVKQLLSDKKCLSDSCKLYLIIEIIDKEGTTKDLEKELKKFYKSRIFRIKKEILRKTEDGFLTNNKFAVREDKEEPKVLKDIKFIEVKGKFENITYNAETVIENKIIGITIKEGKPYFILKVKTENRELNLCVYTQYYNWLLRGKNKLKINKSNNILIMDDNGNGYVGAVATEPIEDYDYFLF